MLQKMKLQQKEMPLGKYQSVVFGLPKINTAINKDKNVLIKTT